MKINNFLHSGKIGDCIYSLPTIRALGGGILYINPYFFSYNSARSLVPLIIKQDYIFHCLIGVPNNIDYNLDLFRNYINIKLNLAEAHLFSFNLDLTECNSQWLKVNSIYNKAIGKVIFARALRAYGYDGFWHEAYRRYGSKALFVGTELEYIEFKKSFGTLPFIETGDMLALAIVINSSDLFIGNQSAPHAVAEGLKKPLIIEVGKNEVNPIFKREKAFYIQNPRDWDSVDL